MSIEALFFTNKQKIDFYYNLKKELQELRDSKCDNNDELLEIYVQWLGKVCPAYQEGLLPDSVIDDIERDIREVYEKSEEHFNEEDKLKYRQEHKLAYKTYEKISSNNMHHRMWKIFTYTKIGYIFKIIFIYCIYRILDLFFSNPKMILEIYKIMHEISLLTINFLYLTFNYCRVHSSVG